MRLHVSCYFICLVSLVNVSKLNTLRFNLFTASGIQILAYGSLIITIAATFIYFNTKRIKYGIITININNFWIYFTFLIFH